MASRRGSNGKPRLVSSVISGRSAHLEQLVDTARQLYRAEKIIHRLLGPPYDEILRLARLEPEEAVAVVENAAWAARIRYREPEIVTALRERLGLPALARLRIMVRPAEHEREVTVDTPESMSDSTRDALRSAAEAFGDNPALRASLERLSRRRSGD